MVDINAEINRILEEYADLPYEILEKNSKKAMNGLIKETRLNAPKITGLYSSRISSKNQKKKTSVNRIWYVRGGSHGLTHLITKGFRLRNGKTYKPKKDFLTGASEKWCQSFVDGVINDLG